MCRKWLCKNPCLYWTHSFNRTIKLSQTISVGMDQTFRSFERRFNSFFLAELLILSTCLLHRFLQITVVSRPTEVWAPNFFCFIFAVFKSVVINMCGIFHIFHISPSSISSHESSKRTVWALEMYYFHFSWLGWWRTSVCEVGRVRCKATEYVTANDQTLMK